MAATKTATRRGKKALAGGNVPTKATAKKASTKTKSTTKKAAAKKKTRNDIKYDQGKSRGCASIRQQEKLRAEAEEAGTVHFYDQQWLILKTLSGGGFLPLTTIAERTGIATSYLTSIRNLVGHLDQAKTVEATNSITGWKQLAAYGYVELAKQAVDGSRPTTVAKITAKGKTKLKSCPDYIG